MNFHRFFTKKAAIITAAIFLIYNIVCFFVIPLIARSLLIDNLAKALSRPVQIEKVAFNPYTLSVTVTGLAVQEKSSEKFISVDRLYGNLSIASLFTLSLVVSEISLDRPQVVITRYADGTFNFSDIQGQDAQVPSPAEQEKAKKKGLNFNLKNASITQGKFVFRDGAMKTDHEIADLNISLAGLNTKREKRYEPASVSASLVVNHTPVSFQVTSTLFAEDMATTADLKTENIDLLHYLSYIPLPEKLRLDDLDINAEAHAEIKKLKKGFAIVTSGNLNALALDLKDKETGKEIFKFDALSVYMEPSEILKSNINFSEILLAAPKLNLERDSEGALNLIKYLPEKEQEDKEPAAAAGESKPTLRLGLFEIQNSTIDFKDSSNEQIFETSVSPLNLKLTELLVSEDVSGQYSLNFKTRADETIDSAGSFSLFPLKTKGSLAVAGIGLKNYEAYLDELVAFTIGNGVLNVNCDFDVQQVEDGLSGQITLPAAGLKNFEIFQDRTENKNNETRMISLPELNVSGTVIDLGLKQVSTGDISAKNGFVSLMRGADGRFVLIESILQNPDQAQADNTQEEPSAEEKSPPWKVVINTVDIESWRINFGDYSTTDPVRIDLSEIDMNVSDLQTFGENRGKVSTSMKWNDRGKINVQGQMDLNALNADLNLKISKLDIQSVQPYFTDTVKLLVTSGDINTKGTFGLRLNREKDRFSFKGSTSITDFVSLDKKESKDFFKCESLFVSDITFSAMPLKFDANAISLTDFYSRVIVNESGELNLTNIFSKDPEASEEVEAVEPKQADPSQAPHIEIDNITLQAGNVHFSDDFTNPSFTAEMKQITGSVMGLSSVQETRASIHLQGVHGNSSPLEVIGEINPLAPQKYVDIGISYKDIELTNFTPYSAKFLGYKIEKGKLILDLDYLVDGNSIRSENRVRFDNLTLGEEVDSEHATALPVSLAISLLKDREGQINLDLPVSGELDDPEFRVGGIILEMIGNLIVKAATSPFSIIGAMFGGGEELGYVDFAFGRSLIDETGSGKLDTMVEILEEKPDIVLEVQGLYHPSGDAGILREKGYTDLLKAEKLKDMVKAGEKIDTLDEVSLEDSEIEELAARAYENAEFPKPTLQGGKEKEIEIEEKIKLLKTNITVDQDDLRLLAMERARAVKAYMLSKERVESERIFLLEPSAIDEKSETFDSGRVMFSLK